MSLTDPSPVDQAEAPPPGIGSVVTAILLLAVGGFGCGYGWGGIGLLDGVRDPSVLVQASVAVGMIAWFLGNFVWLGRIIRRRDMGLGIGAAAFLMAGATGLWAIERTAPGNAVLLTLAAVSAGLGALCAVGGIVGARARERAQRVGDHIVRHGFETTAVVSNRGYESLEGTTITVVTFTFRDHHGTQRWVQKPLRQGPRSAVQEGQETRLWFDPERPHDPARIVVDLARDRSTTS
ncbi:hypothetical protein BW730_16245 [Tessaracoccus aquimaris]|uniref:DUF3592 domain-containing protein n=1 Tax=Tessaracoccus aquimaris TaxID=1332264 RepID=A0A1Q2CS36_9ACTN|nr:hypothetical protein [Tessaracoccus aquimaris]AQP48820.1 hypothetical protein BW730_16245 [Tessaracoccus aquimaris]